MLMLVKLKMPSDFKFTFHCLIIQYYCLILSTLNLTLLLKKEEINEIQNKLFICITSITVLKNIKATIKEILQVPTHKKSHL